ncbi:MAG TPA: CotH kinase family protein, partial [Planctomycetota bacterium]|nr:CotH kinase family protein [Planctomycetota bacterium]
NDTEGYAWKITGKLAFTDGGTMAGGGPDWTQLKSYTTGPYPGVQSPENYRFYFNNTLRDEDDAFEPLIRLLNVMDRATTPDAEYDAKIAEVMNVESSLRVFAVRSLLADWDTVDIGNNQNAYLYYAPIEGRHYLVPWDMDHTFERSDVAIGPPGGTVGFRRLINRPMYKRMYAGILQELNESSWSEAYVSNWTTLVSETGGPARVAGGAGLVSFLRGRRNMVTAYIRTGVGVPFAITTPNPVGFPSPTALIAGTAGLDVAFLYAIVNGGEAVRLEPAWSTPPRATTAVPTIWQAEIPGIGPGKNSVEILAFSRAADFVASHSIEVVDSTGWAPPAAASILPASGPLGGGAVVSISGTGFRDGATVFFGAVLATDVVSHSDAELSARAPAGTVEGPVDVAIINIDGQRSTLSGAFTYGPVVPTFRRGEVDGTGTIDLTDALYILRHLFQSGEMPCEDAADVDDNGALNLTDVIVLLGYLFQGGAQPPEPFDQEGADPTEDDLGCGE